MGSRYVKDTYIESFKGFTPGSAATDPNAALPPPGPLPPELARIIMPPAPNSPVPNPPVANQSARPAVPAPAPAPVPPRGRPTRGFPGADNPQVALMQRYGALSGRAGRDMAQLNLRERQQGAQLPAKIRDARARIPSQLTDVIKAIQAQNTDQANQCFNALEDTLSVIEQFLR